MLIGSILANVLQKQKDNQKKYAQTHGRAELMANFVLVARFRADSKHPS